MRILDLTLKDLRQITREKQSAIFLLLMPLMFTFLFGFAFGGTSAGDDDPRLPVALVDLDNGPVSTHLKALLDRSQVIRTERSEDEPAELERRLREGELAAVLTIPPDYSQRIEQSGDAPLDLLIDQGGNASFTIQQEVEGIGGRLQAALLTASVTTDMSIEEGVTEDGTGQKLLFETALMQAVAAWQQPPVQVNTYQSTAWDPKETEVYGDNAFAHSSPGMMAQFAIAGLMVSAQILVLERKSGCLSRLLTTDLSRGGVLLGHFLAMFIIIEAQLLILILFGQLFLSLPYFEEPAAILLLTVSSGIFAASLGLLIGVLSKSEERATLFTLVPMFLLAGLGGAWVPLEFTPELFQRIAYFTPLAWMVDGFKDIVVRGLGLESVLLATAVLAGYGVLTWLLAAWRFRFE